jgi:hypothetical protein
LSCFKSFNGFDNVLEGIPEGLVFSHLFQLPIRWFTDGLVILKEQDTFAMEADADITFGRPHIFLISFVIV